MHLYKCAIHQYTSTPYRYIINYAHVYNGHSTMYIVLKNNRTHGCKVTQIKITMASECVESLIHCLLTNKGTKRGTVRVERSYKLYIIYPENAFLDVETSHLTLQWSIAITWFLSFLQYAPILIIIFLPGIYRTLGHGLHGHLTERSQDKVRVSHVHVVELDTLFLCRLKIFGVSTRVGVKQGLVFVQVWV